MWVTVVCAMVRRLHHTNGRALGACRACCKTNSSRYLIPEAASPNPEPGRILPFPKLPKWLRVSTPGGAVETW